MQVKSDLFLKYFIINFITTKNPSVKTGLVLLYIKLF
jgi:hypothetical protein